MRILFFAAIAALAPGLAVAASFDISLDDVNGERVLVIARSGGGAAAVAAGGEDLKVLGGEEAERAIASLTKVDAPGATEGKRKKQKIVIHKLDIDEDNALEEREIRIVRKEGDKRREEELLEGEEAFLIEGGPEAASVERRIIRIKGVDEARAIKFIDETKGLDAGERAEMKAAAGI